VVNFNLHGDPSPSSVSIVATGEMVEIARVPTCTMPHGSRTNRQGTRHYSGCMMDDMLVEIDSASLKASRYFILTKNGERGVVGSPFAVAQNSARQGAHPHDVVGHGIDAPKVPSNTCSPTWVQPAAVGGSLFVACNASNELVEIDAGSWTLKRRIPAGNGIYNLAVTRDNRIVATNKRDQSLSVVDGADLRERARIRLKRSVVHGVVVSPDDRYAFVSEEGVGSEPGTVEMIDLRSLQVVASVDVAPQAGGLDFYQIEP
jgi:DNA-binding beta-propeller fold protein YncE